MKPADRVCRTGPARFAFTLLELLVVLVLLAVLASLVIVRVNPDSLTDAEARSAARRISLDLLVARREAIATGDDVIVEFASSGSPPSYKLRRRDANGQVTDASTPRVLAAELALTVSPANPEFTFEGDALASCTIQVQGPGQTWEVQVQQIGAVVRVRQP